MVIPALVDAATDRQLRGAPLGVYIWLLCHHLDLEDWKPIKINGLAVSLQIKRHTASRALHVLVDRGYLARRGKPEVGYEYKARSTRQREAQAA